MLTKLNHFTYKINQSAYKSKQKKPHFPVLPNTLPRPVCSFFSHRPHSMRAGIHFVAVAEKSSETLWPGYSVSYARYTRNNFDTKKPRHLRGFLLDILALDLVVAESTEKVQQTGEQVVDGNIQTDCCQDVVGLSTMHHFTGLIQDITGHQHDEYG